MRHQNIYFFKSGQIYMEDAESAGSKEKSIFRFLLNELWSFLYWNVPHFRWIFTITRKIKIGKLIFHSLQHIAHLSWKWNQNWGWGGGHILSWDRAKLILQCTSVCGLLEQWKLFYYSNSYKYWSSNFTPIYYHFGIFAMKDGSGKKNHN